MSTLIFKVSRYNSTKKQLLAAEYLSSDGNVKAMAYLYFEDGFISGLPQVHVSDAGEKYCTYDRNSEFKDQKMTYNISFSEALASKLQKLVNTHLFLKPTKDSDGVSALRKFQLQVEVAEGADFGVSKVGTSDFITYYVKEEDVLSLTLVSTKDPEFVHYSVGNKTQIKGDLLAEVLFKAPEAESDVPKVLETKEEAIAFLSQLGRQEGRKKNRKTAQAQEAVVKSEKLVLTDSVEDAE